MKFSIVLLICMTSSAYGADVAWDYSQQGNNWATLEDDNGNIAYPFCNGDHQSPINIIREKTILYEGNEMLDFSMAYCDSLPGYFKNNGHTIQFDPDLNNDTIHDPPQSSTYITGGPLGAAKYLFWQFHFHWGSDSTDGSEHLVDGVRNAAEVHLVHVREDYKDDISGALDDPEGLAVLAIFIEGGAAETNDTCWFDPIAYAAEAIADANDYNTKPRCTGIDLNQMVQKINPGYKADFNYWHFMGSLTTPPCSEAAHFIIAERALAITDAQMETFFALTESDDTTPLVDTYREVQDDNCRKVSYVHKNTETEYIYTSLTSPFELNPEPCEDEEAP